MKYGSIEYFYNLQKFYYIWAIISGECEAQVEWEKKGFLTGIKLMALNKTDYLLGAGQYDREAKRVKKAVYKRDELSDTDFEDLLDIAVDLEEKLMGAI